MKFKKGDKVRILDGSKIDSYTGGWYRRMQKFVGKTAAVEDTVIYPGNRIGYCLKESSCIWDERGLELVKPETIVIYRKDNEVIALDKTTGKKGIAKCCPEDTFDFMVGAKLAFDRLLGNEEKKEPEQQKDKFCQEFKKGKTYVFRKDIYYASGGMQSFTWVNTCNGCIVETKKVDFGEINIYGIKPNWCEELPIAVGDMVKVVNAEHLYSAYSSWEGLKGFENNWVNGSALPKDGEYKVVAIKEHERANEDILCLIQNRKTTQVFIMGISGIKKIESEDKA